MRTALTLLTLFVAAPLLAAGSSDLYLVPVASHVSGANGTFWVSDVAIHNFQSAPLTVQLLFIESGQGSDENVANLVSDVLPDGSVTVPAGGNVLLRDVLRGFDGQTDGLLGAIIVAADLPFAVTSRAYSETPSGGSVGQTVPPVQDFLDNTVGNTDNATAVAYVPGLASSARFRTNLGFVAGGGTSGLTVTATLRGANGTSLGTRSFTIAPSTFTHVQFPAASISATPFDAGSAEFRITAGDGAVAPYASIVDNTTASAAFVNGTFPPNTTFGGTTIFRRLVQRMLADR